MDSITFWSLCWIASGAVGVVPMCVADWWRGQDYTLSSVVGAVILAAAGGPVTLFVLAAYAASKLPSWHRVVLRGRHRLNASKGK